MSRSFPILLVDDSREVLDRLELALGFEGFRDVRACQDPRRALAAADEIDAALVVLDLLMEAKPGMEVLAELRAARPDTSVIVATAVNDLDNAIECMRLGAFDYVPKTAETSRLVASVRHAMSIRELRTDYVALKETMLSGGAGPSSSAFRDIVTADERLLSLLKYVEAVAVSERPLLVTGESGTGKELVVAAAHRASGRKGPLVTVNVAGLDDTMFSDTLFGHRRGAFTGADADREGLVERAAGGTLFLDEIGDLSIASQVKLLRLIEDRRYYPLGSDLPKCADAVLVAATNKDLWKACDDGSFRKDLYFRLQTHLVRLPPLRERRGDVPLLAGFFVVRAAEAFGRKAPRIPDELFILLDQYDFPGNVRELESMIHDAVARCSTPVLSLEPFRDKLASMRVAAPARQAGGEDRHETIFSRLPTLPSLRQAQEDLVKEALRRARGNQGIAATVLGIGRTALNRRLKGFEKGDSESSEA